MIKLAKLNGQPEIFHSIQGEGKHIGQPSVFVRLSLCNLYCIWCDTDYTWNWEGTNFKHNYDADPDYRKYSKKDLIIQLKNKEIVEIIEKYNCKNLVITGGEPLVQKKELVPLIEELNTSRPDYYQFEFETNGTIEPGEELDSLTDQYNVSIKLRNSNVITKDRINPEAIKFFAYSKKSNFKFVVNERQDLDEILEIVNTYGIPSERVYLMPQGIRQTELKNKQSWLIEICKKMNFNYTDRLHIHIYGDKRGI